MSLAPDIELVILEDLEEAHMCESILHAEAGMPPHEAHWWAVSPCRDVIAVCEDRRRLCRHHGGWKCVLKNGSGCSSWHEYDSVDFSRIT